MISISSLNIPYRPGPVSTEDVGLHTWAASLVLADYLLENSDVVKNQRILELGAGSAVPSIISSLFGNVTATDQKHVLSLTHRSVALNQCLIKNPINVAELDWAKSASMRESFDVILAADFCYNSRSCQNFFKCLKHFMSRGLRY